MRSPLREYDVNMATLEVLRDVLAVFEEARSAGDQPKAPRARREPELEKAVATLRPEMRTELEIAAKEATKELELALAERVRKLTERVNDPVLAQLVAERLAPSRIGELTPSDEGLTAAFTRSAAKAIAAAHAAGVPVHAMRDGKIVKVPPTEK